MDNVRTPTAAAERLHQHCAMIAALMGGTTTMRAAGPRLLPKWPGETDGAYAARLATATLFPAYARTVSVLTGKPFSKPITIGDDVPPRIAELLQDADCEGRNIDAFAASLASEALAQGFAGILVDMPPNPGAVTVAQERAAGLRPYFVQVAGSAILGWRTEKRGASRVLTQLRILEAVEEPEGEWGTATVEQVRVLAPGAWQVWRKRRGDGGAEEWALHEDGRTTLDVIPFVPVYGLRLGHMLGAPPMLELAHANVEHWQSASDQQTILHVARVPVLFGKMLGGAAITIGSDSYVASDDPLSELRYVEHSGAAIEAGRKSLHDLEDRMRQAGAELLVIKPGNTTQVQTLADNEQAMCDLQRIVQALEDALDQALHLMARWLRLPSGGHLEIYKDFGAATLAEASAEMLAGMEAGGSLSLETLLAELKRRGVLAAEVDVDEEIARIRTERAARAKAAEALAHSTPPKDGADDGDETGGIAQP